MTRRRPKPPITLDATAAEKWLELLPALPDWEPGTLDCLEQYCVAWSKWSAAKDSDVKVRWSRCCRQWMQELGLTPKARRKSSGDRDGGQDPVLKLIGREHAS